MTICFTGGYVLDSLLAREQEVPGIPAGCLAIALSQEIVHHI